MVLGAGYSLWLCNRIIFGNFKCYSILFFKDFDRKEFAMLTPFFLLTFLIGIFPEFLVHILRPFIFDIQ